MNIEADYNTVDCSDDETPWLVEPIENDSNSGEKGYKLDYNNKVPRVNPTTPMKITGSKPKPRTRTNSNTLIEITKKFMCFNIFTENKSMRWNDVAALLGVPKRRFYDIAHVLEGIGYIQKDECSKYFRFNREMRGTGAIEREIDKLVEAEREIDHFIDDMLAYYKMTKENPADVPYSYITHSDIQKSVPDCCTIFGINADENVQIDVSEPKLDGTIQMMVKDISETPLKVVLVGDGGTRSTVVKKEKADEDNISIEQVTVGNKPLQMNDYAHNQQDMERKIRFGEVVSDCLRQSIDFDPSNSYLPAEMCEDQSSWLNMVDAFMESY